ncbi:MAG TPA: endonuclease/exonuclease/phosphatase family protein [Anaerolineae bacterium]|nr:endonuclease/exonuclease/phosphatase family protein [Anaerolineae bacterium]
MSVVWEPVGAQEVTVIPIGAVQGSGERTPMNGRKVTVQGIVTGITADINSRGQINYLIYIQNSPELADGDPLTSDGLPIYVGRRMPELALGDELLVTGIVTEYFDLTELSNEQLEIEVLSKGNTLPAAVVLEPPVRAEGEAWEMYYETLEGMRVSLGADVPVTGATYGGCGFTVRMDGLEPTPLVRPRVETAVHMMLGVMHTTDVSCDEFLALKSGDRVTGVTGPLTYSFEQYRVVLVDAAAVAVAEAPLMPPPEAGAVGEDEIRVVTFNMENYFDLVDDTGSSAEPKPTEEELALKQMKLAYALTRTLGCPAVVGVQEVENEALLVALAEMVAEGCGFVYEVTHEESPDGRGIDVAFMSNPNRVTVVESVLGQVCDEVDTDVQDLSIQCGAGEDALFSRPPLLMGAVIDGIDYYFMVNHFKSKRGGEEETEPWRVAQAAYLNRLVRALTRAVPEGRVVVMGDFNDYGESEPMLTLGGEGGSLVNVMRFLPAEERYSYNFSGVRQLLDGILVRPSMVEEVREVFIAHVNAGFPQMWGEDGDEALRAYRATDHDLPWVTLVVPAGGESGGKAGVLMEVWTQVKLGEDLVEEEVVAVEEEVVIEEEEIVIELEGVTEELGEGDGEGTGTGVEGEVVDTTDEAEMVPKVSEEGDSEVVATATERNLGLLEMMLIAMIVFLLLGVVSGGVWLARR